MNPQRTEVHNLFRSSVSLSESAHVGPFPQQALMTSFLGHLLMYFGAWLFRMMRVTATLTGIFILSRRYHHSFCTSFGKLILLYIYIACPFSIIEQLQIRLAHVGNYRHSHHLLPSAAFAFFIGFRIPRIIHRHHESVFHTYPTTAPGGEARVIVARVDPGYCPRTGCRN